MMAQESKPLTLCFFYKAALLMHITVTSLQAARWAGTAWGFPTLCTV